MSQETVQKPSWWSRNWKWLVPVGALTAIVFVALLISSFIFLIFAIMKNTDAYRDALKYAREDPQVIEMFGGEIKPGWYVIGSVNTFGSGGNASLQIPVSCGGKSGNLYVQADKEVGQWIIKKLVIETNDTGKRLTLVDKHQDIEKQENPFR